LASMNHAVLAEHLRRIGSLTLVGIALDASDVTIDYLAPEGWVGVVDKGMQVMIDARMTPELKAEGMARDVVRLVQDARKDAGLDVADKIALYLTSDSESLKQAIAAHRSTIAAETQATEWSDSPLTGDAFTP